jgi:hypothetical protein
LYYGQAKNHQTPIQQKHKQPLPVELVSFALWLGTSQLALSIESVSLALGFLSIQSTQPSFSGAVA